MRAARQEDKAVVKMVLAQSDEGNIKAYGEWTSLMGASVNGHSAMVKILLAHGAEVNHKTRRSDTALSVAKNKDVIQLLKVAGAK